MNDPASDAGHPLSIIAFADRRETAVLITDDMLRIKTAERPGRGVDESRDKVGCAVKMAGWLMVICASSSRPFLRSAAHAARVWVNDGTAAEAGSAGADFFAAGPTQGGGAAAKKWEVPLIVCPIPVRMT